VTHKSRVGKAHFPSPDENWRQNEKAPRERRAQFGFLLWLWNYSPAGWRSALAVV